jgi:ApaG protein
MNEETSQTSSAVTEGIRVIVRSRYLVEQSFPMARGYVFVYAVRIANEGRRAAQVRRRHWFITDAEGKVFDAVIAPFLLAPPHSVN